LDIEQQLIGRLVSTRELKIAMEAGLRQEHFVDPLHQGCFRFISDYWDQNHHQAAPTIEALNYEFPRYISPGVVEESTEWLVQKIHARHVRNNLHEAMFGAAEIANRDDAPLEALRGLYSST